VHFMLCLRESLPDRGKTDEGPFLVLENPGIAPNLSTENRA